MSVVSPPIKSPKQGHEAQAIQKWAAVLSTLVILFAVMDLAGWLFHLPLLTSVFPHYATMKPNTALCLILLAIACVLKIRIPARIPYWIADGLAAAAGVLSAATLAQYLSHRDLWLDQLILHTGPDPMGGAAGRMSPGACAGLTVTALAIMALDRLPRVSTALSVLVAAEALSGLIGFIFGAGPLYGVPWLTTLAVHTAACMLLLQLSLLGSRPEREPVRSMMEHPGGSGRRRWLLAGVTVVPALVAMPLMLGMRAGLLDAPFTMALLVVLLIAVQTLILWQDSVALRCVEERRKLAERALLQNEKLAVVGRLAASISHEINNPLESIGNLLYLVREAESMDVAREYALLGEQELARVSQITSQTLSFYRESKSTEIYLVADILDSAIKLLGTKIASSAVTLTVDCAPGAEAVRCKEGELRQVFINLISNALEATPAGGRLMVRLRRSRRWDRAGRRGVRVAIADTGCGMSAATLARIFEPFYTTKAETGNGLGLWVAKDLVEKHEGFLRVWSSAATGRSGTVFCVFLPFAADAA